MRNEELFFHAEENFSHFIWIFARFVLSLPHLTINLITMDKEFLIHLCGWIASIGLILGYLPQAIQTIRTRNTDGISLPGFIMMAIGCFAFVVQGLLIENYYLLLTNLITFTCSVIIFTIKMINDYGKKR